MTNKTYPSGNEISAIEMGMGMIFSPVGIPCENPQKASCWNSHSHPIGMGMGMIFPPVGIPMGIPTRFLWEWDGNGN